jgi:photosystem II stability/assembly factor-like uncharacterized protein
MAILVPAPRADAQVAEWVEIGPFDLGGRVSALAVDPQNSQRIVAGTPAGGLWVSVDSGRSWNGQAPWLAASSISALAVHPANPDVMLAGTGTITDAGQVSGALGIIRTDDGGTTWALLSTPGAAAYVAQLVYWPQDPTRVLAATDIGVQRSLDGGVTLTATLSGDAISAFSLDPFAPNGVYAVGRTGLFYSVNRGDTWMRRSAWPLAATDTSGAGTAAISASRSTPGLLYVAVQVLKDLNGADRGMLLKSTDGGQTLEILPDAPAFCPRLASCGFALAITLDPNNDDNLLLTADATHVSRNGGLTWSSLAGGALGVHEIAVTPEGLLLAGREGVHRLDPSWSAIEPRNTGLAIMAISDIDVSAEQPPRVLATTDSGIILGSGSPPLWHRLFGGGEPGGTARWDPLVPSRLYAASSDGRLVRSDDTGNTFTPIQAGLDFTQTVVVPTPFEPSPLVQDTLFTGRLQLFRSSDSGGLWLTMRPVGFPEIARIAPSSADSDRVYFALARGPEIYKADDIHTELLVPTTDSNLRVTSIFPDPAAQNRIYVTMSDAAVQQGRIFKTWDFGQTWQDVTPLGLPPANTIVKDVFGALYVGTANGVWRSPNDGLTWSQFNRHLLAGAVTALRIGGGYLYASTSGRGAFRLPVEELVQIDTIPSGLALLIDGQVVAGPYYARWAPGSLHQVDAILTQTADTRHEFVSWSDGGAESHTVTATGGNQFLTLAVRQLHRLTTASDPANGGTFEIDPPTPLGLHPLNSFVTAVATPAPDHRFTGFSGDPSGSAGVLAFAVMDRPRRIVAHFQALRLEVRTNPPNLGVDVDGQTVATPATYQWAAGSVHPLSAPELIALDPTASEYLAFDGWSDLLSRDHELTMTRDTFVADLTASFIPTRLEVPLAGAAASIETARLGDAPRTAGLVVTSRSGEPAPRSLQMVRSEVEGEYVQELALVPSSPVTQLDVFVEATPSRAIRLAVFNSGTVESSISVVVRASDGAGLLALAAITRLAPGAQSVRLLSDFALLPPTFEGLLTVLASSPVLVSVQTAGGNLRPDTFLDPILLVPFTVSDAGVPAAALLQPLVLTPDTEHRVALLNPSGSPLTGRFELHDASGQPLVATSGGQAASGFSYSIAAGGWQVFRLAFPKTDPSGALTAQLRLVPSPGQLPPLIQVAEQQRVGTVAGGPTVIPRSLPPAVSSRRLLAPVDLPVRDSGLILTNPGGGTVSLTARLLTEDGAEADSVPVSVAAGAQVVVFVRDLFPSIGPGFRGILEVTTVDSVSAAGMFRSVNYRGDTLLAGFPAINGETAVVGSEIAYAYAIDGDSYSSEWWFLNSSSSSGRLRLAFTGEDGVTRYFPFR